MPLCGTSDEVAEALPSEGFVPRISHGYRHVAASGGIWLHGLETNQGHRSAPELVFRVVAGPGFEPG
jgi:hypothetical protein